MSSKAYWVRTTTLHKRHTQKGFAMKRKVSQKPLRRKHATIYFLTDALETKICRADCFTHKVRHPRCVHKLTRVECMYMSNTTLFYGCIYIYVTWLFIYVLLLHKVQLRVPALDNGHLHIRDLVPTSTPTSPL